MNKLGSSISRRATGMGGGVHGLLVGIMWSAMVSTAPAAPPAGAKPPSGDMRAAYAGPIEVAEGKRVAAASCSQCHGMNGVSPAKAVPILPGSGRHTYISS